jgi:2-C-methyl-D-erythritol 4-phosphate cytidylyltransferase/2-C-methyl-D-erythritol 2,4-cyclodiphosphate synthase
MHISQQKTIALIVAGGAGQRFGGAVPKQYATIAGQPILARTLQTFLDMAEIDGILVVIRKEDAPYYQACIEALRAHPRIDILLPSCMGGALRQDSVRHGLVALEPSNPDIVLIQDAVRPFVSASLIRVVRESALQHGAAVPLVKVTDTIKEIQDGKVLRTHDRERLGGAQTPQGFHFQTILRAHQSLQKSVTDDAELCEAMGIAVAVVPGEISNRKITMKEDLPTNTITCVGQGYDVHRFTDAPLENASIPLCGVNVPHSHGIVAHSDGDVAIHALVDAMLGAVALGDIGQHFPPSDDRWKGMPSKHFLAHALTLLAEKNAILQHIDVTIIAERPKVGPYREAMQASLSDITGLPITRISIKATTTERLGFTGRKEGIAAMAVATVVVKDSVM